MIAILGVFLEAALENSSQVMGKVISLEVSGDGASRRIADITEAELSPVNGAPPVAIS